MKYTRGVLDMSARTLFTRNIARMKRYADDPASDFDRWHMRIMVVLLTSALEGCDVEALARMTGYSQEFIHHVWERVSHTGLELNPLKWISDSGFLAGDLSSRLWADAGVIEGRIELEHYSDGGIGFIDLELPAGFEFFSEKQL
jgi:hypothetical protein